MLNVFLTKTGQNTEGVLSSVPQNYAKMKAKITSFLTFNTISSLPHFFWMLDNSYFLNVLKSECLSTWDCGWLLTVNLFL